MAAKDLAGSPRNLNLNGVPYRIMADANISEIGSQFENESIPTSGTNMRKMTKRSENRESVVVAANADERDQLKALADQTSSFTISYETAAGDVYRTVGFIEFENRETEENRATLTLMPNDTWSTFVG